MVPARHRQRRVVDRAAGPCRIVPPVLSIVPAPVRVPSTTRSPLLRTVCPLGIVSVLPEAIAQRARATTGRRVLEGAEGARDASRERDVAVLDRDRRPGPGAAVSAADGCGARARGRGDGGARDADRADRGSALATADARAVPCHRSPRPLRRRRRRQAASVAARRHGADSCATRRCRHARGGRRLPTSKPATPAELDASRPCVARRHGCPPTVMTTPVPVLSESVRKDVVGTTMRSRSRS